MQQMSILFSRRAPVLTMLYAVLVAKTHGTPLFVYSKAAMLSALAAYQRGFAGRKAQICYAMKANSSLAVLQVFAQAGCGFDIVSGGELERVCWRQAVTRAR
jgi:diaminopimelate decarboxylase